MLIAGNLSELEAIESKINLLAVKPPRLLDKYERRIQYSNNNGLIQDVEAFEVERKAAIIWTEEEKGIYRDKYNQFPKDFDRIADCLPMKSVPDCILYYYQNKKRGAFKVNKKKSKRRLKTGISRPKPKTDDQQSELLVKA